MTTPSLPEVVVLALGAWRAWRVFAVDDVAGGFRSYVSLNDNVFHAWRELLDGYDYRSIDPWDEDTDWGEHVERPPFRRWRFRAARFVRCPWCSGFWMSSAVFAAWLAAPSVTLAATSLLAISGIVGLITVNLDKE